MKKHSVIAKSAQVFEHWNFKFIWEVALISSKLFLMAVRRRR